MIFLVLAAQFESLRDPLVILVSVPMSICGALMPLFFGLATMNIYTQVGLVTLIGLISKHGILMVEFANQLQLDEGLDRRRAIERAARVRLRPILMTTAAMVVGLVPLVTARGAGAASRFSIGLVVVAGMSIGTLFTLFVLPAVYTVLAKDHAAAARSTRARELAEVPERAAAAVVAGRRGRFARRLPVSGRVHPCAVRSCRSVSATKSTTTESHLGPLTVDGSGNLAARMSRLGRVSPWTPPADGRSRRSRRAVRTARDAGAGAAAGRGQSGADGDGADRHDHGRRARRGAAGGGRARLRAVFYRVMVCAGVLSAVAPLASFALGAGDRAAVGRVTASGLILAAALTVPVVAAMLMAEPVLDLVGYDRALTEEIGRYLRAIVWGAPGFLGFAVLRCLFATLSRARIVMIVLVLCCRSTRR